MYVNARVASANDRVAKAAYRDDRKCAMKPGIVLDKSFLQGASGARIAEIARSYELVMCESLFYELLTSEEPGRSGCFAKLREDNPVALVSDIGPLLGLEIDRGHAAGRPSSHRIDLPFRFNPKLVNRSYVLPAEAQTTVDELTARLRTDVASFLDRVEVVPSFFPDLLQGSDDDRRRARTEAEEAIVAPRGLVPLYAQLEPPAGETPLPPAEATTDDWALFRYLQMQMLFALDAYVRYHGRRPDTASAAVYERIEHDVLDAQVAMLGCLEGALATHERKLQRWFPSPRWAAS